MAGPEGIPRAVEILLAGGLVAFPTETVYGLGADASNHEALARLYHVKGRPRAHPVIVHLRSAQDLDAWARDVPAGALALARAFWPGPLTLVLQRADRVPEAVTGGHDTIALRVPAHALARELLEAFAAAKGTGAPAGLAAPSANRYGKVSPTAAAHVVADLGAEVDLVLDGGPCEIGIASTILDLSGKAPVILRPGKLASADIERVLGRPLESAGEAPPPAPGTHPAHYAPRAKLKLASRREIIEALVTNRGRRIAVLALEVPVSRLASGLGIVIPAIAAQYARALYANLRVLDAAGADIILVETPPRTAAWTAVHDRLQRAAAR
ncbi:MAG: threonylcarbamoyl-AMP synthase [Burkholderiales bacterium]|nr:threonylcarbamoyl-AMP synthase [Burkholderiales bacterium]